MLIIFNTFLQCRTCHVYALCTAGVMWRH